MTGEVCPRCWHGHNEAPSTKESLRRLVGFKPRRIMCGEPTDLGPCPCQDRFHCQARVGSHQ